MLSRNSHASFFLFLSKDSRFSTLIPTKRKSSGDNTIKSSGLIVYSCFFFFFFAGDFLQLGDGRKKLGIIASLRCFFLRNAHDK